ncbi:MAG TPA: IclR family transcriptional regulator [Acidimicrobiales bacterium]|nr:IclR family transcriptional regulator [Acidimicrobiales bacterium]
MQSTSTETSVMKALEVLNCFRGGERDLGVTEITRRTGIPKSSVHRLCATLTAAGYLVRTERRGYRLGLRVFEIGSAAVSPFGARTDASRFLQQLTVLTGETSQLGVLDEGDVVYIDKIETPRSSPMPSQVGRRNPAHATGIGKALLAWNRGAATMVLRGAPLVRFTKNTITTADGLRRELQNIMLEGVAYDREERHLGTACVAAPVRNHLGEVVAALSVSGPVTRMTSERLLELAPVTRQAAIALSKQIGWRSGAGTLGLVASGQ